MIAAVDRTTFNTMTIGLALGTLPAPAARRPGRDVEFSARADSRAVAAANPIRR
jgi:hypothetical protein